MSGSERVMAVPKQTSDGPIDENVTYTLTTANACGGTTTKTATLHVVGSIDPPPPITLASMFYPTGTRTSAGPRNITKLLANAAPNLFVTTLLPTAFPPTRSRPKQKAKPTSSK